MPLKTQNQFVQGSSVNSFDNYGLSNSYIPTITGIEEEKILLDGNDTSRQSFFDDTMATTGKPEGLKRVTAPNFVINVNSYGDSGDVNKTGVFVETDSYRPGLFPDGDVNKFVSNQQARNEISDGKIDVFERQEAIYFYSRTSSAKPTDNLILQDGKKFINSELVGGLSSAGNSRFDGETLIVDYYDLKAGSVIPLFDLPGTVDAEKNLEGWKIGTVDGSPVAYKDSDPKIDINITPFVDQTKKDCDYRTISDPNIVESFSDFVSGTADTEIGCDIRFANHGFEYLGAPRGTDSLAFGGLTR
jgi:hypothetical protein